MLDTTSPGRSRASRSATSWAVVRQRSHVHRRREPGVHLEALRAAGLRHRVFGQWPEAVEDRERHSAAFDDRGARSGIEVEDDVVGRRRAASADGPPATAARAARWRRGWPPRPGRGRRPGRGSRCPRRHLRRARRRGGPTPARGPGGACRRRTCHSTPSGNRFMVSGRSPHMGEQDGRDVDVVADEVAFGESGGRIEDLVQIRQAEGAALRPRPASSPQGSRTTSSADLSVRRPRHTGWRRWPAAVHSRKATSPTITGTNPGGTSVPRRAVAPGRTVVWPGSTGAWRR